MCGRSFLLGVVCVLFAAGSAVGQPAPSGVIRGRVVDLQPVPLQGVKVTLTDLSNAKPLTAHTDLTGRFTFPGLPSSKYSLTFDLEGYAVQQLRPYEVLPGIPVEVSVELKRLAPPLTRPRAGLEGIAIEYGLVKEQIEAVPVLVGSEGRTPVDKLLSMVPGASPTPIARSQPLHRAGGGGFRQRVEAVGDQLSTRWRLEQRTEPHYRRAGRDFRSHGGRNRDLPRREPHLFRPGRDATPARLFRPSLGAAAANGTVRRGGSGGREAATLSKRSTDRVIPSTAWPAGRKSAGRCRRSGACSFSSMAKLGLRTAAKPRSLPCLLSRSAPVIFRRRLRKMRRAIRKRTCLLSTDWCRLICSIP